jgi:hypothetical protein
VRFGDVVFDRISASVFHYRVQKEGSQDFMSFGQEATLSGAIAAVESALA